MATDPLQTSTDAAVPFPEAGRRDDERLRQFAMSLVRKKNEAIQGRRASGIEQDWIEDEEYYQGIDDANRAYARSWVASIKRNTAYMQPQSADRSVVFMNITRPYVDAAAARVSDMLLPTDDRAWALKPAPVPEVPPDSPEFQIRIQLVEAEKRRCEGMQDTIDDALIETNWHAEVRTLIEDCARIGSGVLKGPYPKQSRENQYRQIGEIAQLQTTETIIPASRRIDPWNLFPDPSCGESIHNGAYVWERDYITAKQLKDLRAMPGYDPLEIAAAIRDGPRASMGREASDGTFIPSLDQYEIWYFHGVVERRDLEAYNITAPDDGIDPRMQAMAVMVNDRVLKVALNVLETGCYPYDVLAWQRRPGLPFGSGVARHIRTAQRMLNAATRAMMDNAGLIAGPQIVIGNGVVPADGKWEIRGRKIWRAEADVVDVTRAFFAWVPPSMQAEFMRIIEFAQKMAEDTTGMPMLLQGQSGSAPDTVGGMRMLMNNATAVMRRLAKRFDDYITEPHIRRYYDWFMQYAPDPGIKGEFTIDVRGSSALVERDQQAQALIQMGNLVLNPAFGVDPSKYFAEWCKSQHLDPEKFQYTDEERARMEGQSDPLTQAKLALTVAQTEKTKAEAVEKSVEGMYSATQAATLVQANPAVAQSADELWQSAGGMDRNGPPITEAAPNQQAAVLPPSNTHPNFPALPDTGVNAGIEGGAP
jgi:hypothetical protein